VILLYAGGGSLHNGLRAACFGPPLRIDSVLEVRYVFACSLHGERYRETIYQPHFVRSASDNEHFFFFCTGGAVLAQVTRNLSISQCDVKTQQRMLEMFLRAR
jgi:hypothetical protein